MPLLSALAWLSLPEQALAQVTAEQAIARAKRLTAPPACAGTEGTSEIVVCGRRKRDEYRVPASGEGGLIGDVRGRAGEVPSASPERLAAGPCGIFQGERRCGKAEARQYGYGGGKDPISALVGVGKALLDPD